MVDSDCSFPSASELRQQISLGEAELKKLIEQMRRHGVEGSLGAAYMARAQEIDALKRLDPGLPSRVGKKTQEHPPTPPGTYTTEPL